MTEIVETNAQPANMERYERMKAELATKGVSPEVLLNAEMVHRFAPYAEEMTRDDALFVAIRCDEMGVHPMNDKAIQVYKDSHGIHIDYHYSLIAKYVSQIRGIRHTQPRYTRLTTEQLEEQGLAPTDIAYFASFVPRDAWDDYYNMMDRMSAQDAYDLFAVRGIGSTSKEKWDGFYFAPNGRSKAWKVYKRALKDAYVTAFGYPSPSEARSLQEKSEFFAPSMEALEYSSNHTSEKKSDTNFIKPHTRGKNKLFKTTPEDTEEPTAEEGPAPVQEIIEPEFDAEADAQAVQELQAEADAARTMALPEKWPDFSNLAVSKLGFTSMSHVLGALKKDGVVELPYYTSGSASGKMLDAAGTWTTFADSTIPA